IKQVGQFMQKKFGKDSQVYKEFEEDFVLKKVSGSFERFESVVQEVSSNQGKFVSYIIDESELKINTDDYSDFLSSCVHLFRNAVDHGIEDPSERVDKNKPEQGKITVSFEEKGKEFFRLKVKDDGRGINPGVIKKAALKLGLKSESEIMNLKDEELIQLIFDQGISSKEKVTDVSGRGVGMDAIKAEAEKVGGKVWVESQVDVGTTFFADLPLNIKNRKSS
ncbi:MAG: ATP-binding protein, partial [Bdellovibrionota bacterium]|nr:ATP-binding protein [Bdellovibrionota bacterium]